MRRGCDDPLHILHAQGCPTFGRCIGSNVKLYVVKLHYSTIAMKGVDGDGCQYMVARFDGEPPEVFFMQRGGVVSPVAKNLFNQCTNDENQFALSGNSMSLTIVPFFIIVVETKL